MACYYLKNKSLVKTPLKTKLVLKNTVRYATLAI